MGQWLHLQARYLHLLLEMEGLTKAPKCSMCSSVMEVKCSNCIGGNYFCKACCIQSHKQTPFHQMAQWTRSHFSPVSLYSLGFVLYLGHHGDPCPLTVEVHSHPFPLHSLTYDIFRVLKLLRTVSPHSRSMSTLVANPSNQSVQRGPWQQTGCPVRHRCLYWMGRTCKEHATLYLRPCLMSPPEAPKGCAQQSQAIH